MKNANWLAGIRCPECGVLERALLLAQKHEVKKGHGR